MKVQPSQHVELQPVNMEGASGCQVRWLLGERDGAPNFAMRQFELAPGGYTPRHFHDYEHEVYVLEGQGTVIEGDTEHPLRPGDVVLVSPNDVHQFRNTGETPLRFLCLIPNSATSKQVTVVPECGLEPAANE
jgi:quercetin dioxygenase-like cupin family protein